MAPNLFSRLSCIVCFILSFSLFAQQSSKIDSLKLLVAAAKPDSVKVKLLADLCWEHMYSDPQKSITYGEEALSLARKISFSWGEATMLNTLGSAYSNLESYSTKNDEKALEYFSEALRISIKMKDQFIMAASYHNIALVYKEMGELDKALEYYNKQLAIAEKLNSPNDRMHAAMGIGQIHTKKKEFNLAGRFFSEALELSKGLGTRLVTHELYGNLSESYTGKADYKKALAYHKLHVELRDSLFNEEKSKQISELHIKYKTEKKEDEINRLNDTGELKTAEISQQRLLRNFFIAGFAFVLIGTVVFYRNARYRKRANRLLAQQKRELEELNALKSKLFSVISHDLRSPLTSLHGLLQILEEKDATDIKPFMTHANSMMGNTINLLDNLLYWSADQVKGITVQLTEVHLFELAEEMGNLFQALLTAKQINFVNRLNDEVVYADLPSVRLIMRNLISNAIKFTLPGGSISIFCVIDEGETEISIVDSGIGMSVSELVDVFTYKKSPTNGTNNEKGVGLGLLLCKEFVEKNGGKISVESEPGKGTTFRFTLQSSQLPESSVVRLTKRLSTIDA